MLFPVSWDYNPQSSYEFPVDVPSVAPFDGTFVEVQIPEEYIPLILGSLSQLLQWETWSSSDPTSATLGVRYANELIYFFQARTLVIPIGSFMPYGGTTAPAGWLFCDGSEIDRFTYAELFAVIGTAYGAGDGVNTFNLPSTPGRTVVGAGTGSGLSPRAVGDTGGEETHLLTASEIPSHTHTDSGHTHTTHGHATALAVAPGELPVSTPSLIPDSTGSGSANNQNTGGGTAHNNMQPFVVGNWIIKA